MPTPKDGVLKTDLETYPGNGCGRGTISVRHACGLNCVDDLHYNPPKPCKKNRLERTTDTTEFG